jgi:UDP-2,3-diacylglucosamine hydrolase
MKLENGKKIYFASDFHLGVPTYQKSRERELKIVSWLSDIQKDAEVIYLVGDIFDFWFEYKQSIPKYFTRFFGKIAELTDSGIEVVFFTGNHDMWMFDYLIQELGIKILTEQIEFKVNNKSFLVAHGDGLGPGDTGYKFIKKIFRNKVCIWLFARLHPDFGIGLANYFSRTSRKHSVNDDKFLGEDKEWLITYSKQKLEENHVDYFIYGHRHHAIEFQLSENSTYYNLGEWISQYNYLVFDGEKCELKKFEK